MTGTLSTLDWIDAIDEHYLAEYLPGGGSAVKFVVCFPPIDHNRVISSLHSRAADRGLLVASVDAAGTKIHLVEQFFGRIADQVPWNAVTERILARFARDNRWQVPERFSPQGVVEQLEQLNRLGLQQISLELQRRVAAEILADRRLAKDFRVAMHWLARARLEAGTESDLIRQHLTDWLGGRIGKVSALRRYQMFTKINRANARYLLGSLLVWVRDAGYNGLVVSVDGYRMLSTERVADGFVNYTQATLLDAYELFREFIDSTDDLEGLLLSVFMPPEFLEVDSHSRGLGKYPALLFRVYDEVRDRNLANPLSALNRIRDAAEMPADGNVATSV